MKAVIQKKYGSFDVLNIEEVEKPAIKENEVLVKVFAASIGYSNLFFMEGKPWIMRIGFGLTKPKIKIPGGEIAGEVVEVGSDVTKFKPGDKVWGDLSDNGRGGFAQYVAAPEFCLRLKVENISYESASAVPEASQVAYQALVDAAKIKEGDKVLIHGSSGGIGSFAVQIAKALGAEVTAICSTGNIDMLKSLGADFVIDYTKEDFVKSDKKYDVILSTAGYRSIYDYKKVLNNTGSYVCTGGKGKQLFQAIVLGPFLSSKKGQSFQSFLVKPNKDLDIIKTLIEEGKITPIIDRIFSLNEISMAMEYYSKGHSKGRVVLSIPH